MGHATRCVPLINQFLKEGHNVIIGADKIPLVFLKQEFPELKIIVIPGYEVSYDEKGSYLKLFYESIQFFNFIKKEHDFIDEIIEENTIDLIVSDNRYGLWSKKVKSIIITHQLFVKTPLGEKLAHKKIEKLISNFTECWIPDEEGESNLSGDLSHLKPFGYPHKFIGPLSRFSKGQLNNPEKFEYDIIAILSGPEPQRTIFENLVLEQIKINELKAVVVRGLPKEKQELSIDNSKVKIFNHLSTEKFLEYIERSKIVVCRAGYTSIMDLSTLDKKGILVPTPGQTEQEYLAEYHLNKGNFYSQKQGVFDLKECLIKLEA
ncbi:glycosyltransferase [Vicingaceae bacterium]|nr:glycosyltransferase [Vicingaceae bacterium]